MQKRRTYSCRELLDSAGCTRKAFRVYRERGLIPVSMRAGQRRYHEPALHRLRLVAALRDLGMGIDQIEEILQRHEDATKPAAPVARSLADDLGHLVQRTQDRIERLQRARNALVAARESLTVCALCREDLSACSTCASNGDVDGVTRTLLTDR